MISHDAKRPYEPGQWVQVYGQVCEHAGVHPDDVLVEFFSHSDQYRAHVLADRVRPVDPPEGIAERCNALRSDDTHSLSYLRCTRHLGHGGEHNGGVESEFSWPDSHVDAYVEER